MTQTVRPDGQINVAALLVAAGSGTRMGGGAPKQFRPIAGRSAVSRCLEALSKSPDIALVVTAIRAEDLSLFDAARQCAEKRLSPAQAAKIKTPIEGGAERQETVRRGLEHMAESGAPAYVAIHDAARPFLSLEILHETIAAARRHGAACVGEPLADTLRRGDEEQGTVYSGELIPREGLWRAQTPQVFSFEPILSAHRAQAGRPATDDVEIASREGLRSVMVPGSPELLKITRPNDQAIAEALAQREDAMSAAQLPDIRVGQGFDVHKFGPNADGSCDHVMLCGVRVPHETGLVGHSDADVGLHALTDAVLGAAALGDIGRHFPPTEEKWRGASSDQFLQHAIKLAQSAGGRPSLLDVTLICERPKIGPLAAAMRSRIAEITSVDLSRVSVKATTSEGLGFTGRREGIAALASATLIFDERVSSVEVGSEAPGD